MREKKIPDAAVEKALHRTCARLEGIVSQRGVVGSALESDPSVI
jgi:hypothetical protein